MSNRCPSCNKFVALSGVEIPDDVETDISRDILDVRVRMVRSCEECGEEMKALEEDQTFTPAEVFGNSEHAGQDFDEWEVASAEYVATERTDTTVRRGKKRGAPIRNPRYWTTYHGVDVTVYLERTGDPDTKHEFSCSFEAPASAFEEV